MLLAAAQAAEAAVKFSLPIRLPAAHVGEADRAAW
jgi:hypothetical protein